MVSKLLSGVLGTAITVFIAAHLLLPNLAIDTTTLALLVILTVVILLPFAKSISLPGGASIELKDLEKARAAVDIALGDTAKGTKGSHFKRGGRGQSGYRCL